MRLEEYLNSAYSTDSNIKLSTSISFQYDILYITKYIPQILTIFLSHPTTLIYIKQCLMLTKLFQKQYQCNKMKEVSERSSLLPEIQKNRNQKPIKEILKDLKGRKIMIESRIKTQLEDQDEDEVNYSRINLKDKIITEVPFYRTRRHHGDVGKGSVDQIGSMPRLNIEDEREGFDKNYRQNYSQLKKYKTRRAHSIFEPITSQKQIIKQSPKPKNKREILKQVQDLCLGIPVHPKDRTEESVQRMKLYLSENNIFFSKIHHVLATCILKLNRIFWVEKGQILYKKGDKKSSIYLIMHGRLKMEDSQKELKKFCYGGESLGEEVLFGTEIKRCYKQSVRATSRSLLVQIKVDYYNNFFQQMTRFGYKVVFNQMESILKRNHITKNWLRGEKDRIDKRS